MTLRVLTLVTLNNDGLNIEKAFECDILRLLEALCLEHLHDKNITFHVCSLIRNLTAWREVIFLEKIKIWCYEGPGANNRQLIYESKIVSLITNILRTHFSNDTLCWAGTSVLLNLSTTISLLEVIVIPYFMFRFTSTWPRIFDLAEDKWNIGSCAVSFLLRFSSKFFFVQ